MALDDKALEALKKTSRTFFIPIIRLPGNLRSAVGSAYLCFRAIDEIEDHPVLPAEEKIQLLHGTADIFRTAAAQGSIDRAALKQLYAPHKTELPKVTLNVRAYGHMAPEAVRSIVWSGTATMADRMAYWVKTNWAIHTQEDLDSYTYDVAGCVGLLLTDLWAWYDGTQAKREDAVGFGRSLQAVNIIRNRTEDGERGVDYFPDGWDFDRMCTYIRKQFAKADAYMNELSSSPARDFCQIPLTLAKATLEALENGKEKLSRDEVLTLVNECTSESTTTCTA